jgi:hypothetical protein
MHPPPINRTNNRYTHTRSCYKVQKLGTHNFEPPKFSRTSKSELQVGAMVDLWSQPTICIPQKFNPEAIKIWDLGKLKTWFVFDMKIIQTKTMENLKFQKPEMCNWKIIKQLEDVKVEFFCPQGWGLHGITPIWYPKSPKLNPLVSKRNRPKLNPLVNKQNRPKLNPLVSKQNPCCVPKTSLKLWEMGKSFHPIRFKDF